MEIIALLGCKRMAIVPVQSFVAALISAHLVFSYPLITEPYYTDGARQCKLCPPGQYAMSCAECAPCQKGFYTAELNAEPSCHQCFRDCRSEFHLEEIVRCTNTTNVKCRCQPGYNCTYIDAQTGNCRDCKIDQQTTLPPGIENDEKPMSNTCIQDSCDTGSAIHKRNTTNPTTADSSKHFAVIFCAMVVFGILVLILILCIRRPGEPCFKQALKFCNKEVREASCNSTKEPSHRQLAEEPQTGEKHQPIHPPAPTANMGPVHVYSAGTVVFSLLNQFTGVGAGAEVENERAQKKRDEEGGGSPSHPTTSPTTPHPIPSPNIHLSQEERNGEMECVFFPSQEQGKESHMSKEEGLI
ncbi:hypothetical protein UPYG_G00153060 [Umbra pygmaea]|uniref:TNFR-Cys domain-containing protein n=1 Tax=Umbra pygmaea TaxID=75934 RepID=A0ABD0X1X5_UMBPY